MKNKTHLIALACGVLSLGFGATAHAQTIINGDFTNAGTPDLTGWTPGGIGAAAAVDGTSALAPGNGTTTPGTTDLAYTYHDTSITQDLIFAAHTAYTLTVEVAMRAQNGADFTQIAAPYYIVNYGDATTPTPDSSNPSPFPGTLGATNFTTAPVTDSFVTENITFTTTTGGAGYITFGNNYGGTPSAYDDTADFTHVTLSGVFVPVVPEPSTWSLSVLGGLLGLALMRRHRINS